MKRLVLGILLLSVTFAVAQTGSGEPVAVGFAMRPHSPRVDTPIHFKDYSKGNIVSWLWDFGDGTTSTERNPVHTYTTPGEYTITLTVSDAHGTTMTLERGS